MDLFDGLADGEGEVILAGQQALGLHQAGEGGGGHAEQAKQVEGFIEVVVFGAHLDDTTDVEAEQADLVGQAGKLAVLEGGDIHFAEMGGVEAVLDGVAIAGLAATPALGGGGSGEGVHGPFIANMF